MLMFHCSMAIVLPMAKKKHRKNIENLASVAQEVGDVKHLVSHNDPTILVAVVLGNLLSAHRHGRFELAVESGARSENGVSNTKRLGAKGQHVRFQCDLDHPFADLDF